MRPAPFQPPLLGVQWAGRVPYIDALNWQDTLVRTRREGRCPDQLLLLEHPHVLTAGRGTDPEHILWDAPTRAAHGLSVHEVGRGGDITYHGPGQIVGYPILALEGSEGTGARDLHRYLRDLEEVLISVLARFRIVGARSPGQTGVWTEAGKIAAIGVRVSSGWITSHGFALNVEPDLHYYRAIVPCGLEDRRVTSMAALLGHTPSTEAVVSEISDAFRLRFNRELTEGVRSPQR